MRVLLAGDVGGTKTALGLYDADAPRLAALDATRVATGEFDSLTSIVETFLRGRVDRVEAACLGVAGPVRDDASQLTNVPWRISAAEIASRFAIPRVTLLNDVAAAACALPVLGDEQIEVLHAGEPDRRGHRVLMAVGTGLGEAILPYAEGEVRPVASEAGHTDFPARTPRELEFVAAVTAERGRVSCEQVLSGPGLVNLARFTHRDRACPELADPTPESERPAAITDAAISGRCTGCVEALDLFVSAMGAEAGNLGLRGVATGGVYLGGGIPRRILQALGRPAFLEAFWSKSPMERLLRSMPVRVITDRRAALLGSAVAARQLLGSPG